MSGNSLYCGTAIRDITPTVKNGILPMPAGFSANIRELTTVHDPLYLRVIALKDAVKKCLLISLDIVNMDASFYCPKVSKATGIPEEAIFFIETTSHSTVRAGLPKNSRIRNSTNAEGIKKVEKYKEIVLQQMLSAVDEATEKMIPVRIGIGRSESYVNTCRDVMFHVDDGGEQHDVCQISENSSGPSDKTVAVVCFEDMKRKPIAFLINYAVFNVLMDDNMAGENGTGAISGDLAGYVSTHIEEKFPGTVAIWCGGANCDQDPIMKAKMHYPDPKTGGRLTRFLSAQDCDTIWNILGSRSFADTLEAIKNADNFQENASICYASDSVMIPGRTRKIIRKEGSRFEKYEYSNGSDFTVHLTVLRIGDLALIFHGGSIYASIGMQMKKSSILKNTLIITGYVNSKSVFDGAVVDDVSLARGGHDADRVKYRPGFIESALVLLQNHLLYQTESEPYRTHTWQWISSDAL